MWGCGAEVYFELAVCNGGWLWVRTAIMRDAQDPQLHANLARLGPVKVDHHMKSVRLVSRLLEHHPVPFVHRLLYIYTDFWLIYSYHVVALLCYT